MQYVDMVAVDAALKELASGQEIENLVGENNPFLAMVPKKTDFGGRNKPIPIITGTPQGRSSTFTTAQANQTAPQVEAFLLTSKSDYSLASIDNRTLLSSATDKMAFLEVGKLTIEGVIRAASNSLASALWRSGTGTIGTISTISTGVITLSDRTSATQFERDMVLQANATDGGTPRAALGYIVAVDTNLGTVTVSASGYAGAAGTPSGWTAGDSLLVQGDNNLKISGVPAWIPPSAPSSTPFYNVDRSVDPTRLGGVRFDGSAYSIEEALIEGAYRLSSMGGPPADTCWLNFASYTALIKGLGSKVQYVDLEGPGKIAFRGVRIQGAQGEIKVIPDRNHLGMSAHLLVMSTWELDTLGPAPRILTEPDGNKILRVSNADAGELRAGYYGNLACRAPGWNAHITLGA